MVGFISNLKPATNADAETVNNSSASSKCWCLHYSPHDIISLLRSKKNGKYQTRRAQTTDTPDAGKHARKSERRKDHDRCPSSESRGLGGRFVSSFCE